jgi:hypothetical protein
MRRLPAMMASASAAALTTLAVTVAVPALAGDAPGAKGPDPFAACLREHGFDAPDGPALDSWLRDHMETGDDATRRVLKQCDPKPTVVAGPTEQELRSCLEEHGADVPAGDGRTLKRWIFEHGDDAANRDTMLACDMRPPGKPGGFGVAGSCEKLEPAPPLPAEVKKGSDEL